MTETTQLEPVAPAPIVHRVHEQPADTGGVYMVLKAPVPVRAGHDGERPALEHVEGAAAKYVEVGYFPASSPEQAVRKALDDPDTGIFDEAKEGLGLLIRAVPAMHWYAGVEATGYFQPPAPPPVLHIGRVLRARGDEQPAGDPPAPDDVGGGGDEQ